MMKCFKNSLVVMKNWMKNSKKYKDIFVGKVSEVDKDNLKLKAIVEMFGRDSVVELNFNQVRVKN